jgi:serine/threonine protein kinase
VYIFIGILHLHCEKVIHRDLALRNLLLDETWRVRVCDFGMARFVDHPEARGQTQTSMGPIAVNFLHFFFSFSFFVHSNNYCWC